MRLQGSQDPLPDTESLKIGRVPYEAGTGRIGKDYGRPLLPKESAQDLQERPNASVFVDL